MKMWSGRFRQPLDPEFERWQRSFPFDRRLLSHELNASRAHAHALQGAGILSAEELASILFGLDQIAERAHDVGRTRRLGLDERQVVEGARRQELAGGAPAHRACADDDRAHASRAYRKSGPESSRQPPPCGGTPPRPRRRSAPAMRPATPNANMARRITFTWG